MISPEQLIELSNFLNASPSLPTKIQEIADALKAQISPVQEEVLPTPEPAPEVAPETVEEALVGSDTQPSEVVESNG